jgi:trimeric autotransporter adhesin
MGARTANTRTVTTRRRATSIGVTALALAMLTAQAAIGATGNLPGGTAIEVTIDDPAEDLVIEVEDEDDLVDLTVTGTAEVGGAAVVKNTTLIYILDRSGSMRSGAGVDCTGDASNDARLVCQAEAVAFVNSLAADPASPVGLTGIGAYASTGSIYDVDLDPDSPAPSYLVAPDYDGDGNGIADLEDVVRDEIDASGGTNFSAGLEQAKLLLTESPYDVHRVVFISDGRANRGGNVNDYAGAFDHFGTTRIDSFAITSGSGCDIGSGGSRGSLIDIASLGTTPGTCTEVEDLSDLNLALGTVLASELTELTGSVNGGPAVALDDVAPALPQEGPVSVDYSWDVGALGVGVHELCVTATGSDGGGEGSVTECRTVTITVPAADGVYPPEPEVLGEVLYPPAPEVLEEATPATPVAAQPDYTG